MKPKQEILNESILEVKMIHEALLKEKYFDLHTDEAKQHLLVAMIIQMKKEWYFAGIKKVPVDEEI